MTEIKTETEEDKLQTEPPSPTPDLLPSGLLVQQRWHNSHVYMITCKHKINLQLWAPVPRRENPNRIHSLRNEPSAKLS